MSVHGGGAAGLGLEVNVDYLAACVLDLAKQVRYRHVASADNRGREPAAVLAALSALADEAVAAAAGQGLAVAGAAVALPGMLDRENGVVRHAPNLGWADVPVAGAPRPGHGPSRRVRQRGQPRGPRRAVVRRGRPPRRLRARLG
ncbi:ROK family protein [Actinomadura madurae]|nr:ROK family protein [Actinomadura madurae]